MIIYKITNNVNGKIYIGQTCRDIKIRMVEHRSHAKSRRKYISYIHRAITKYGIENFSWEVIEVCSTMEELDTKEKYYIEFYGCIAPNGYNFKEGGRFSPISRGEAHPMYGRRHTEESKRKMSESRMGISAPKPDGFGEKISKAKAKDWLITTPCGDQFVITNLMAWCSEHNLNRCAIKRPNGTKGYKAVRI